MHSAFSKRRSGHAKSNQLVSSRPSSPHQNADTTTHKEKRDSDGEVSPKPSDPPSPPTLSSHARQPSVEESGPICPPNCVNDVSIKRSAPPRPRPPSQVKQSSQQVRLCSLTKSSQTESKPASHSRSKSLFSHSHKSSTNQASHTGNQKRKGCPLRRTSVVRSPITKHAITKSGDWDKEVYCEALYDFHGEIPCDLQFRKGQRIAIVTRTDDQDDWWEGTVNGTTGIFPANYVSV